MRSGQSVGTDCAVIHGSPQTSFAVRREFFGAGAESCMCERPTVERSGRLSGGNAAVASVEVVRSVCSGVQIVWAKERTSIDYEEFDRSTSAGMATCSTGLRNPRYRQSGRPPKPSERPEGPPSRRQWQPER